ncbi:MAG: THUMP domain-containing protein [Candidatus Lokiarchaeota archaeon]|nr:THUMP domain-containing protein [Candidatus Harpocratesius repetitus]
MPFFPPNSSSSLNNEYNLIIARYVEIGLKSRKVRNRMEKRLMDHILSILNRESLSTLQSSRQWGRLIFQFEPKDIEKALLIFRNIIGIHSYSPVIRVSNSFDELCKSTVKFAQTYLKSNESFAVRVKRFKLYPKNSLEIEREIGGKIYDYFTQIGKPIKVNLKQPQKTIYLEIKEKEAYLFGDIYYSAWGGNPIETDKAMFALWNGNFGELSASFLLTRRGTVVIPLVIYNSETFLNKQKLLRYNSLNEKLHVLASFYSEPINVILLDYNPLIKIIKNFEKLEIMQDNDYKKKVFLEEIASLLLISHLVYQSSIQNHIKYGKKTLIIKGFISNYHQSYSLVNHTIDFIHIAQSFSFTHFIPLSGLSIEVIKKMEGKLMNPSYELITEEFSLSSLILKDIEVNNSVNFDSIVHFSSDNIDNISIALDYFVNSIKSKKFSEIIESIIENAEFMKISSKIS